MKEIWKPIPYYPNYEASNFGRVRSYASRSKNKSRLDKPHLLKQTYDRGYYRVGLCNQNGTKLELVHRAVLLAFYGEPPQGQPHACHNDGDGLNNFLDNLRWDSVSNNHLDKLEHGTMYRGEAHHFSSFTESDIKEIRKRAEMGETHRSIAGDYGVTRPTISFIVKRKTWKHVS